MEIARRSFNTSIIGMIRHHQEVMRAVVENNRIQSQHAIDAMEAIPRTSGTGGAGAGVASGAKSKPNETIAYDYAGVRPLKIYAGD